MTLWWNIYMFANWIGRGRTLCMSLLPGTAKQRIQMGLRKGNTVLIYFQSGVVHYQCVLIALASDLSNSKPRQGQRNFWRYVSPLLTYFAWLLKHLALTYCRAALEMHPRIPYMYGEVHHLQGQGVRLPAFYGWRSLAHAQRETEVVLWNSVYWQLALNGPLQRRKLFTAALKLLRFAVGIETVCCENEEQRALKMALLPLLRLEDGHVLATLSAIVLALCEGRTGLAISGVFGAGKTRSAAALLAGDYLFLIRVYNWWFSRKKMWLRMRLLRLLRAKSQRLLHSLGHSSF